MTLLRNRQAASGYTLIEIVLVVVVIALLASFAMVSFGNTKERRDATMIQSAQASLQQIISQGATRMDMRPDDLATGNPAAVINAVNAVLGNTSTNTGAVSFMANQYPYRMTIANSSTWAVYAVQNGDVVLTQVSPNLTAKGYSIQNGILVKYP